MPNYKIVISKRPDLSIAVFKDFNGPEGAFNNAQVMVQNIYGEPFDLTKHSITVEEQKT